MMVGMFSVSENFVLGVLGPHWSELIPVFKILCFAGVINSIATVTGSVYLSQGASKTQFKVNLFTRPLVIIFVVVGLAWGVEGVASAIVLAAWVSGVFTMTVMSSLISLKLISIFRILFPTFLVSIGMGIVLHFSDLLLTFESYLVALFTQVFVGIFVYLLFSYVFRISALKLVVDTLRKR